MKNISDWVVWNQRFKRKIIEYFMSSKKYIFFFLCISKMVNISVETRNKTEVSVIHIHENDNANKKLLKLLCISDIKKDRVVKNFMT